MSRFRASGRRKARVAAGAVLASLVCGACAPSAVPPPNPVVARYADALRRGDESAVWALLTADSRRDLGHEGLKQLLIDQRKDAARRAQDLTHPSATTEISATVRFEDGEVASFSVEEGQLRLQGAAALPARAETPEEALSQLRAVLARRSYPGLLAVLSKESAAELDAQMQSLVDALEHPEQLEIRIESGRAVVELSSGHRVELIKDQGLWKIRDFE